MKFIVAILICITSHAFAAGTLSQVAALAQKNQSQQALTLLSQLEKNKSINADLALMTRGRILFQMNQLDKAFETYEKVPKASDYWFESIEEKAHIMGRKGQFAKALALLQTTFAEPFENVIGPEPFFVAALTQLKICDYTGIFKTTQKFKSRFQERTQALKDLSAAGDSEALRQLAVKVKTDGLSFATVGALSKELPRNLARDQRLQALTKNSVQFKARVKVLANAEIKEINDVLSKLQIIEAEVVHRIHVADHSGKRPTQGRIDSNSNTLTFPDSDEVWIDELDAYAAQVEKCPATTKRASL